MANTPSAEKRHRQNQRSRARNRAHQSRMRTAIKKLRGALDSGDAKAAQELLVPTLSLIDHTASLGVIHRNTAARYKSRLTRAVRAAAS